MAWIMPLKSSYGKVSSNFPTPHMLLQPLDKEERTMFRFLRARKMNIEAAADMLQSKMQH